ncbi:hypothetical protein BC827DRAFT_512004 [Russula dissimulans]|jgi:hypothetical protein|nr:hypothetical protein BC827DRAFT_512004 [Russula dissimulans]
MTAVSSIVPAALAASAPLGAPRCSILTPLFTANTEGHSLLLTAFDGRYIVRLLDFLGLASSHELVTGVMRPKLKR